MPPPRPTQPSARYFLRRRGQTVTGPHDADALGIMLSEGKLDGSEEISPDGRTWRSVRSLSAPTAPAPIAPAASLADAAGLDLDDRLGISLAPLEIGFPEPRDGGRRVLTEGSFKVDDGAAFNLEEHDEIGLGPGLELVEREPAGPTAPRRAPGEPRAARGTDDAAVIATGVNATVASFLAGETDPVVEATQPVHLDEKAPRADARTRPRTMTAARGGGRAARGRWRPSRRLAISGVAMLGVAAVAFGGVVLDLPGRLRPAPIPAAVLGALAAEIAQDRYPSFAEGARRLEDAVAGRRRVSAVRAAAALLLAASVVIHGAERSRIVDAETLLDANTVVKEPLPEEHARAQAWVALAKGRWKDAERLATDAPMSEGDRAVIRGWAALGREQSARSVGLFASAVRAEPAPAPSRVAARYALARAREADLAPEAEAAYRAVLTEAPAHVGAGLGLLRVSRLSPAGRIKLGEALLAKQAGDASRAELGEAHTLVARAARELGDGVRAQVELMRAREVDPSSIAAAVAAGDALLADGHADEAASRYKLALAAPLGASRTLWLRLARMAALFETARSTEGAAALADLERRLPDDPRVAFWRGWAAERAIPADPSLAEHAYRQALARDPRFLPASLHLARLLLEQHRATEGLGVLRRAEAQGAAAIVLRIALGRTQLASGNADSAARTFREALTADSKDKEAHLGLAGALEAQGNLEGARAELATLVSRHDVPDVGSRLAEILIKLGRREEALVAFQQDIASGAAAPTARVAAARLALELGRKQVARGLAESVVKDDPRTPGALLVLAEIRRAEGDLGNALLDLRRALAVDGSPEVQLEYGRALAALGRDEDALSALEQARQIPAAGVERARILIRRGEIESAIKDLSAATVTLPSDADAFLLLGQAEDRLGHVARAEAAWKSAVKLAPSSAEARYRLGRLEMDHGQAVAALPNLRVAAERVPTQRPGEGMTEVSWRVDLYFQLGFAETRQGSHDRALTAFRRYLELAPADAPARVEVTRQIHEIVP